MSEIQIKIDALLVTAAIHMMQGAFAVCRLRESINACDRQRAEQAAARLAEELDVVTGAMEEVQRLGGVQAQALSALRQMAQSAPEGLVH